MNFVNDDRFGDVACLNAKGKLPGVVVADSSFDDVSNTARTPNKPCNFEDAASQFNQFFFDDNHAHNKAISYKAFVFDKWYLIELKEW